MQIGIAELSFGLAIAGAIGGVWKYLQVQIASNAEKLGQTERDLAAFKLQVAREYATMSVIKNIEERILAAVERLGDRLDRVIDRNG